MNSGAQTSTLALIGVTSDMSGNLYRCRATNRFGVATSHSGELAVLAGCESSVEYREKSSDISGAASVGAPDSDGNYHDNSSCLPRGGYNWSGLSNWLTPEYQVQVTITWVQTSVDTWTFSGSVDRGNVPEELYPEDPVIYGTQAMSNTQAVQGECALSPNGASVFFGATNSVVAGPPEDRQHAWGPSIGDDPSVGVPNMLGAIGADDEIPWEDGASGGIEASTPDGETGDFSYKLTQPRFNLTGLIEGDNYTLTLHYQKYIDGTWQAIEDLEYGFVAAGSSMTTDWIDVSELNQYLPGQIRLHPTCPASLVHDP